MSFDDLRQTDAPGQTVIAAPSPAPHVGRIVLSAAIFASAFLLFQVQPLIGKYILPWFGGAAQVWTVCLLFFQLVLLGGYAYAHASIRWLGPRAQVAVHAIVLVAALALLPITPDAAWRPQGAEDPTGRILAMLAATLGLPYLALSATAPLLQAWSARLYPGRPPYRLYALSNAASLLALLTYPLLVEPLLTRPAQAVAWSIGFGVFAALCAGCGWMLLRYPADARPSRSDPATQRPGIGRLALWLLLPATGSALLLGATNKICQDVAAVPFLWVLPLSLYLLTFIVCFDSPRWYSRLACMLLLLGTSGLLLSMAMSEIKSIRLAIALYGGLMLAGCMLCHGELARLKPDPSRLTMYYLCIAAGGALGGIWVAVLAPVVFRGYYELHLAALVCCGLAMLLLLHDACRLGQRSTDRAALFLVVLPAVFITLLMYIEITDASEAAAPVARVRNFHGVLTVADRDADRPLERTRLLRHGTTTHGAQYVHPSRRRLPTTYYGPNAGAGLIMQACRPEMPRRIGVVGLGVGTLASYGKPGDLIRFYEVNPAVERLARAHFTYLADSAARVEVVLRDARLALERQPPQRFDLLIIDAFSGDAIPMHLITREAVELYLRHLADDGVLLVHISNHYLDLQPVLAELARQAGLIGAVLHPVGHYMLGEEYLSEWVVLTRDGALLDAGPIRRARSPLRVDPRVGLWTDDYASLLRVLK